MKYLLFIFFFAIHAIASAQIIDLDLDFPVSYARDYIIVNDIGSITFIQSGESIKKEIKNRKNGTITYYFDTTGIPNMKVLSDKGFTDTFMMNGMRCEYKSDPDSRFYEPNVYCNSRGQVVANQSEKSSFFYKYDDKYRIAQWVRIDRDEEVESGVLLTTYTYNDDGKIDQIIEKEGELRYNLGLKKTDTIYKSTVIKKATYANGQLSTIVTYTNNNLDQTIESSVYKYKYKGDVFDQVELYIGDDKKPIYTLKMLKTSPPERE